MLVRELARVLNGIPGDFQIWVDDIQVHFGQKLVEISLIPKPQPPPIFNPIFDKKEQDTKFFPNEAGWTAENEFYYQKWKNGGNDLTYLEELEEIDRIKQQNKHVTDDTGSNTLPAQ